MDYPILDGQQNIGTLLVREEGLYRVCAARLGYRPGVHRLWLCGEAGAVCLGVLLPEAGTLALQKRLSRAAWEALPHPLLHASLGEPASASAPVPVLASVPAPAPPDPAPHPDGMCRIRLFGANFVVFRS